MKKSKKLIYGLLVFSLVSLISCGPEETDYIEKVVGEYDIRITPSFSVKYGNNTVPISMETVETTCSITAKDDDGNVFIQVDGVNGLMSEMNFDAYCDGLGMRMENNSYDGMLYSPEYGYIYCDIDLKNPTVSIYNSSMLSWKSTVTGSCEINISGLDNETCELTGSIQFEATDK